MSRNHPTSVQAVCFLHGVYLSLRISNLLSSVVPKLSCMYFVKNTKSESGVLRIMFSVCFSYFVFIWIIVSLLVFMRLDIESVIRICLSMILFKESILLELPISSFSISPLNLEPIFFWKIRLQSTH